MDLIPLLVGSKKDKGDQTWGLLICFMQILEKLCALSFNRNQLIVLTSQIEDFFMKYLELFPDANIKPKSHFLKHYPEMIWRFGPLVKTLRFEAKHSYFKGLSQITNNRKNMPNLSKKTSIHDVFALLQARLTGA